MASLRSALPCIPSARVIFSTPLRPPRLRSGAKEHEVLCSFSGLARIFPVLSSFSGLARILALLRALIGYLYFDNLIHVQMISGDTPVLFAKACELFILELTLLSFAHTEDQMRMTIRRCDIANAIYNADEFDFLTDIVPPDAKVCDIGAI